MNTLMIAHLYLLPLLVSSGEGRREPCNVPLVLLLDPCCLVANIQNEVAAKDTKKTGSVLHFSFCLELFALDNSCVIFRYFFYFHAHTE